MKDLRMLPSIKDDKKLKLKGFFHPSLPVYFRVDLLKTLIAFSSINTDEDSSVKYTIVSDMDVEPLPPSAIFDSKTLKFLNVKNYVFNIGLEFFTENSFMIFKNSHETLFLESFHKLFDQLRKKVESASTFKSETVFEQTPILLGHLGEKWVKKEIQTSDGTVSQWTFLGNRAELPRKAVSHPISQFVGARKKPLTAHQQEQFVFKMRSNDMPPHVRYGRNYNEKDPNAHALMISLVNWSSDPLPSL